MKAIIDIETTGINSLNDRIVMIGYLPFRSKDKIDPSNMVQIFTSDEKKILDTFINNMKSENIDTLIGWKIDRFDIPFIKARLLINGMREELTYFRTYPIIIDIAEKLSKEFTVNHSIPKMKDVCSGLNIDIPDTITGADVPTLFKTGVLSEIKKHNAIDIVKCAEIYKKLF